MRDLTRRKFFKQSVLAGVGLGLGGVSLGPGGLSRVHAAGDVLEKVPRKPLGSTGRDIPILLMGCAQKFNTKYDKRLHRAFRQGVDYLDAALAYGTHHMIAPFIRQVGRENLWLTSKGPHYRKKATVETFTRDLDKCLKELGVSDIDLYFMHSVTDRKYLDMEFIRMGEALKKSGKTAFFGFSCHGGNVVELLNLAAQRGGIDAVMFRYSFAQYGDKALNKAIDRCKQAGIGLIAMKTQNSVPKEQEAVVQFQSENWTLGQAKLKAVWADERIDAAVSKMASVQQAEENIMAAKSIRPLTASELQQLSRLAALTAPYACQGCNHICEEKVRGDTAIADTLRYLMYYESYDEQEKAVRLYRELTGGERAIEGLDFSHASAACPQGIDIAARLAKAKRDLGRDLQAV